MRDRKRRRSGASSGVSAKDRARALIPYPACSDSFSFIFTPLPSTTARPTNSCISMDPNEARLAHYYVLLFRLPPSWIMTAFEFRTVVFIHPLLAGHGSATP